ncbi:hypothetical protein [Aeromicrobium sp. CF3.5]|uniref:hypothetical protein n=1 Tax=Aeromicrobium sp. CF3.5 TaxID=3373078 RepID=UPI003EE6E0FA
MLVLLVATAVALVAVAAFWLGRRSAAGHGGDLAALWRYQQALNDCGHEIDTLLRTNGEALSDTSRDELVAARVLAYPHVGALRHEARGLILRASVPSLADSGFDLVDLAHAYLALSERLADEILRVQRRPRRWRPLLRDTATSRVRSV